MSQRRTIRLSRDGVLFGAGLLGIVYQTVIEHGDRPTLLVLFGAMVGLPAFLRGDEKTKPPEPAAPAVPPAPAPAEPPTTEGGAAT